jgi:hypothetical protein
MLYFSIFLPYVDSLYSNFETCFYTCWVYSIQQTLCDKVCQLLATGQWFSLGAPVSSTNKIYHYNITEILLKVALNTITPTLTQIKTRIWNEKINASRWNEKINAPRCNEKINTLRWNEKINGRRWNKKNNASRWNII